MGLPYSPGAALYPNPAQVQAAGSPVTNWKSPFPSQFSQLTEELFKQVKNPNIRGPAQYEKFLGTPAQFKPIPESQYQVGTPQSLTELENAITAINNSGMQNALLQQKRDYRMGMGTGNPYAQRSEGGTPQDITQRAFAAQAEGIRDARFGREQANADQYLRAAQQQTEIDSQIAAQNVARANALAGLTSAGQQSLASLFAILGEMVGPRQYSSPYGGTGFEGGRASLG